MALLTNASDRLRLAFVALLSAAMLGIVLSGPLLAREVPGDAHAAAVSMEDGSGAGDGAIND